MRATQLKAGMRLRRTSGWALVRSVQVVDTNGGPEARVQMERADAPRHPAQAGWLDTYILDDEVQVAAPAHGDVVCIVRRRTKPVSPGFPLWAWLVVTRGGFTLAQGDAWNCPDADRAAQAARSRIVAEASGNAAPQGPLGTAEALAGLLRAVEACRNGTEVDVAAETGMTLDGWMVAARRALDVDAATN